MPCLVTDSLTASRLFHHAPRSLMMVMAVFGCLVASSATAEDWPQILGPNRDGQTNVALKPGKWPTRMNPKWSVAVGAGFSAPIVVGDKVILLSRVGDREILKAMRSTDGKLLWETGWPSNFQPQINRDPGPRATPVCNGKVVVCWGAEGTAAAVDVASGKLIWKRELRKEYGARDGFFGAGSSPIIVEDRAVFCVGGRDDAGIVALSLDKGETLWKSTSFDASYASPILVRAAEQNWLVVPMRLNTVVVDPKDGQVQGDVRFGSRGPTVNAATPIVAPDNSVWLTANYGVGTTVIEVAPKKVVAKLSDSPLLGSHYNTPVLCGGRLFGIDGYEDRGNVSLRAIDPGQQEILWQKNNFGTAHLLAFQNSVLAAGLYGQLTLFKASGDSFQQIATTDIGKANYLLRTMPAYADSALYIRNNSESFRGGETLFCYDLSP